MCVCISTSLKLEKGPSISVLLWSCSGLAMKTNLLLRSGHLGSPSLLVSEIRDDIDPDNAVRVAVVITVGIVVPVLEVAIPHEVLRGTVLQDAVCEQTPFIDTDGR